MSLKVVRRLAVTVTGAALAATLGSFVHAQAVPVNNPPVAPRSILVFPQRDFVSSSGFEIGDLVTVEVFHPGATTPASTAADIPPQDDPATAGFDGIVEVNHPGGACWAGVTPDIRPGDRVRTTRKNAAGTVLGVDETTVANVVAKRPVSPGPGTIEIHGTAQNADGTPIDITQLEQRLVAPRDAFDLNGRRTLRAAGGGGSEGTISYDAAGTAWTATYTGLDAADVTRALNAESRIMWLGSNPAALVESTIYEIGAGIVPGPSAPCSAPLEKLPPPPGSELTPPSAPSNVTASVIGSNTISINWTAATDNVGVTSYGIYRNGVPIANVENPDGAAPAPTQFEDFNVPAGTYTYTIDAADAVGNRSAQVPTTPASITATQQIATPNLPVCSGAPNAGCVSDPPAASPTQVQIIAFPARDFTSSSGYAIEDSTVAVQVIRNGFLISTANVIPVDDPTTVGFDGIVEVNHPGGGCWVGVTPDLRAGDIVRQIAYAKDGVTIRRVDQAHVSNVSVARPVAINVPVAGATDGVVQVHGTAMDANGAPIPLDQLNQRLVAGRDRFDLNGRRTLRAGIGEDGVLEYDTADNPDGIKFTATYTGLDENDVYRAVGGTTSTGRKFAGAESRILFLGLPTAIAPEMTIYENSDVTISGPAAGACTAALEPLDVQPPSAPLSFAAARSTSNPSTIQLSWAASTDDTYVNGYGIYRDGKRIRNVGPTVVSFDDVNVPAGNHTYAVDAVDSASPLKVNYPLIPNDPNFSDPILQGVEWGNRSPKSAEVAVGQPDVLAPSVPTNLVGVVGSSGITLTWAASTDDVAVTGYRVYRAGLGIADPAATTYTDPVTTPGTYTYTVDAADAAGNRSAQSSSVTVTITATADKTAPTVPGSFAANTRDLFTTPAAPAIGSHDVKLSWTASSDNSGVAGYTVYRRPAVAFGAASPFTAIASVNGSTFTYTDVNVPTGSYDYTVDAFDSAANRSAQAPFAASVASVDDPPQGTHLIIAFPQRDFVSSAGYAVKDGPITVSVIRGGKLWAVSTPVAVVEDPATPGLGAAEVNHPGGGCWDPANGGITPDLRPGDIVRFTNKAGKADQTAVANLYADRVTDLAFDGSPLPAGTIQVHGWAQDAAGNPLPIDQVENRIVATSANPFLVNGRRTLRAPGDGSIAYDPIGPANPKGVNWTATYTGLAASDVVLAKASDSRAFWLGRSPLAPNEQTIFENGDGIVGGPSGPACTAPAEAGPAVNFTAASPFVASFDPGALTVAFQQQDLGKPVTQALALQNVGSADPARKITGALVVDSTLLPAPGDFSVTAIGCSGVAPGNTCTVAVTFTPVRIGVQSARLLVIDNANNSPVQMFTLSGEGVDLSPPTVTVPVQTFAAPAAMSGTSVSALVTATATDFSGVQSMALEQSSDGGNTWVAVPPAATTFVATSATTAKITATVTMNFASTYRFRAFATDTRGNKTAPGVASAASKLTLTDDGSGGVFNGWSFQRNNAETAGAIGSTLHTVTGQAGKTVTASFTFTGTEVALVSSIGPDRGQMTIAIDGGKPQIVDLYAPSLQKATVVGSVAAPAGKHTLTISVQGAKNGASTGTKVDVDAFVVKN